MKLVLLAVLIARYLGPEKFGTFNYVISFVSLLAVLAEFRLQNILTRELSKKNNDTNSLLGSAFYISLFFATIGYLLSSTISYFLHIDENYQIHLFILLYASSYFFQTLRILRSFYISKYNNIYISKIEFIAAILILLFTILFIIFDFSLVYFILLRIFDVFIISFFLWFFYSKKFNSIKLWRSNRDTIISLVKSSFPLVLSGVAIMVFQRIDQIMLGQMIGLESVGQYSAAVTVIGFISFIPVIVAESYAPNLVKNISNPVYDSIRQNFSDVLIWGTIFFSILLYFTSPIIINILFGPEYIPAIKILKLFSIKAVFVSMGAVSAQIMIVENTHQLAYVKSVFGGISNIILNYFLIESIGMIGAVWASLFAFLLSSYIAHLFIKRYQYIFVIQSKSIIFGFTNTIKIIIQTFNARK